jgi:hypothetical protein
MRWCLCPYRLYALSSRRYLLTTAISARHSMIRGVERHFNQFLRNGRCLPQSRGYRGRGALALSTTKRTRSAIPFIIILGAGWGVTQSLTRWDHASDRFANFSLRRPPSLFVLVILVKQLLTNLSFLSNLFPTAHHNAHSVSTLSPRLLEQGHSAR